MAQLKPPKTVYWLDNTLYLNITNKCANNCYFCLKRYRSGVGGFNLKLKDEPTAAQVTNELSEVLHSRVWDGLVFCGFGEPTSRLDTLIEIARWVKAHYGRSLQIRLDTNGTGTLLNPQRDVAAELKEAGVDGFLHSVRDMEMDDALVARMKQKNVFITPNLAIGGRGAATQNPPWYDDPVLTEVFSPAAIALVRPNAGARRGNANPNPNAPTSYDMQINSLRKLNRAGVIIALGDDTGIQNSFPGYAALQQMERMAEAGMTPQQVLVAKQASFIVLDRNPLDSLANMRTISAVYLRGQELNRAAMRAEFRSHWK
jgi:TatD family-associated radical SAM protein